MREAVEMKNATELYYCQPIEVRIEFQYKMKQIFDYHLG
jgi:hypothetical protein